MIQGSAFDNVRHWLFAECLPFWAANGPDRRFGGFVEELDFNGNDAAREFKRTRVACRQIYVFSHARVLGWEHGAGLIADGVEYLTTRAWMGDKRAFARRLTRDGEISDKTIDLYDHAFALFAFAWAYRACGDTQYLDWAKQTLDSIEAHLRHPSQPGFLHQIPATGWRQQNPHMHLLEASLCAFEFSQEAKFANVALEVFDLFKHKFFQQETGTLAEFFSEDWSLAPGVDGERVEPGHQYEWIWILKKCQTLLGVDAQTEMHALANFSERFGTNPITHVVYNAITRDGQLIDGGSRTWPNTERIKAGVALAEASPEASAAISVQSVNVLLERYLASHPTRSIPAGAWVDAFDAFNAPAADAVPASTLYHLFLAFAEFLSLRDAAV